MADEGNNTNNRGISHFSAHAGGTSLSARSSSRGLLGLFVVPSFRPGGVSYKRSSTTCTAPTFLCLQAFTPLGSTSKATPASHSRVAEILGSFHTDVMSSITLASTISA